MAGNFKWHSCSTTDFPLKRNKVFRACETCRSKKIKCDGLNPCQRCKTSKLTCEYTEKISRKRFKKDASTTLSSPELSENEFYKSSLLPLLFDFFNLTSQPMHIWNNLLLKLHDDHSLSKEALHLFMTYNSLYSAFIHAQQITLVLYHCILSITFYSAYQSLVTSDEYSYSFYNLAHSYYKKAHKSFIEACFLLPLPQKEEDQITLIQASILLAHFQCQAIQDQQAYMTIRMGLDLTHRFELHKNKKSIILLNVLNAWHVWLSLYLKKPYSQNELELPELITDELLSKEQTWAIKVTDIYTNLILKKVLLKKQQQTIMEDLKYAANHISAIDTVNTAKNPFKTIQLYHNTLTIQLFTIQCHQLLDNNTLLDSTTNSSLSSQSTINDDAYIFKDLPKEGIAVLEYCIESAQQILTSVNHHPPHIMNFLPVLYSICQVTQLCMHPKASQFLIYNQLISVLKNASHLEVYQVLYTKMMGISSSSQQQDLFMDLSNMEDLPIYDDDFYWVTLQHDNNAVTTTPTKRLLPQPAASNKKQSSHTNMMNPGSNIFFASEVQTLHLSTPYLFEHPGT